MKRIHSLVSLSIACLSALTGMAADLQVDRTAALGPLEGLPCGKVRPRGYLREAFERNLRYLKSLDDDSLLYIYRFQAGLRFPGTPTGGWEAPTSTGKGSFLGHWISAAARSVAVSGDPELKAKVDRIVEGLAACQRANGNGFVHGMQENWFDALDRPRPGARDEVLAFAYYQTHKLLMGLSFRMKAGAPCAVACLFWGDEVGPRDFDVLVDGRKIAPFSLARNRPGRFFWQEFPVPEEATAGKEAVTVRFQARPGNIAGGVFHLMTLGTGKP